MKAHEQREHPSLENCYLCDAFTGKAGPGDGSLYDDEGCGPYCEGCYAAHASGVRAGLAQAKAICEERERWERDYGEMTSHPEGQWIDRQDCASAITRAMEEK